MGVRPSRPPDVREAIDGDVVVRRPSVVDLADAPVVARERLERGVPTIRVRLDAGLVALAADDQVARAVRPRRGANRARRLLDADVHRSWRVPGVDAGRDGV